LFTLLSERKKIELINDTITPPPFL